MFFGGWYFFKRLSNLTYYVITYPGAHDNFIYSMKKLNVLFISHDSGSGGAERCLFDLVSRINRQQFNIYINTPDDNLLNHKLKKNAINYTVSFTDRWIPYSKDWGINHLFKFMKSLRARIWSIEIKINNLNIDLVYSNTITCIDGAIAAKRMGVPHIWHIHENITGNRSLKSYLPIFLTYRIVQFVCRHFIVVSKAVAHHINGPDIRIHPIFNGVDIEKFNSNKTNFLKKELEVPESTKIIGQVGTLMPAKGIMTFIEAAEAVLTSTTNKQIAFILVGSGTDKYTAAIKHKISNSMFHNHFFLLGQREDIPEIMAEIDILVLASESEGLSRVVIEAMGSGKPVVATKCGGPEEIIVDSETGFLVPVKNAQAIAEKVTFLLAHPEQAEKMGQQGRLRAQSTFNMDQYVQNIEKVMISTINNEKK